MTEILLPDNPALDAFIKKHHLHDVGESRKAGRTIYIVGDGGIGKTTLCGTLVESEWGSPCFYMDIDGGVHVIADLAGKGIYFSNFDKCIDIQRQVEDLGKECPFRSIVLDNASALFVAKLREVTKGVPVDQWWTYYNGVTFWMLQVFEGLQKIAHHYGIIVVVNMWSAVDKEEATGIEKIIPLLNPATVERFQGIPDIIGYLSIEPDSTHTRKLTMTPPSRTLLTKFRRPRDDVSSKIPDVLWNPSLAPLVDTLINGTPFPVSRFTKPTRNTNTNKSEE